LAEAVVTASNEKHHFRFLYELDCRSGSGSS